MKRFVWKRSCAAVALAISQGALAAPEPGSADDNAPVAKTADTVIDQIVVTATRRDTAIQSVPISMSALPAKTLASRGIRSVDDIAYAVPGLSFTSNNDGTESLSVRGIIAFGSTATTAYYIDETPISQLAGGTFSPRYFDIERVEVLRGPQGTLYGASAMGGAVRVITKKPSSVAFEGAFRAEGSTTVRGKENGILDGAINIPIIDDRLAVRVTGFYENQSGTINKFTPILSTDPAAYADRSGKPGVAYTGLTGANGQRVGKEEIYGGRASIRALPNDAITLTGSYSWQQRKNNGFNNADTVAGLGFTGADSRQARVIDEFRNLRSQLANFTAEADFGLATLTSSTSYESSRDNAIRDGNSLLFGNIVGAFGAVPSTAGGQSGASIASLQNKRSFTQEVRLVSNDKGPFNWIVGGFYNKTKLRQAQDIPVFGLTDFLAGTPSDGLAPNNSFGGSNLFQPRREFSVFGEMGYKLSDKLSATIGLRRYDVRSGAEIGVTGLVGGGAAPDPLAFVTDRGFTYKTLVKYTPVDDLMLFASYTTGYRPGGVNPPRLLGDSFPVGFTSDKLAQYELGWKTRFLNRALTFNGALFYIDWKDIPTGDTSPSGIGFTFNGPKARTYGGEAEIIVRPNKGLDITLGMAILDAKFAADFASNNVSIAKGDILPNVPKYTFNAAVNYEWPIGDNSSARINANIAHVSSRRETANQAVAPLPGFLTTGISAGINFGRFELSIFARNLFDKRAVIGNNVVGNEISGGSLFEQRQLSYLRPRTIGASIQFPF